MKIFGLLLALLIYNALIAQETKPEAPAAAPEKTAEEKPKAKETRWQSIKSGAYYNLARNDGGTLWACGSNLFGQLGKSQEKNHNWKLSSVGTGQGEQFINFSAGFAHNIAVRNDGTLWAWGWNKQGQLGINNTAETNVLTQVSKDSDWACTACGDAHSIAVKINNTLWAWGDNIYGQLGLGDTIKRISPTQVGTNRDWTDKIAASSHTLAIQKDGTLWAWGYNGYGQLGLGDNGAGTNRLTPTQVTTETNWASVDAGFWHTIAIKKDPPNAFGEAGGTLWAWGVNWNGQLGLGEIEGAITPTQVTTNTDWSIIECGGYHSFAIKANNTLWAFGFNIYGQLGAGDAYDRLTPFQVGSNADWVAVSAGYYHSEAIKLNSSLWSWGNNKYGQLGLGDYETRYKPVLLTE